jgi:hypothetical protein
VDASLAVSRRPPPRRRRLIRTCLTCGLAAVLIVGGAWSYLQEQSIRNLSSHVVVPDLPGSPPVLCRTGSMQSCAQKAADTTGQKIAWMQPPPGYHLAWFFASDPSTGDHHAQALFLPDTGGQTTISLESATSAPLPLPGSKTVRAGSHTVKVSQQMVAGTIVETKLTWRHGGRNYSMVGTGPEVDEKTLVEAWRDVEYSDPS